MADFGDKVEVKRSKSSTKFMVRGSWLFVKIDLRAYEEETLTLRTSRPPLFPMLRSG
jgi:hypothetical protein